MKRKLLAVLMTSLLLYTMLPLGTVSVGAAFTGMLLSETDDTTEVPDLHPEDNRPIIKILSIGHSFSRDAMDTYMADLFKAAGYNATFGYLYYPGASLERHYHYVKDDSASYYDYSKCVDGVWIRHSDMQKASTALADEDWDVVTFQPSSDYGQGTMSVRCDWGCDQILTNDYVHFDQLVELVKNKLADCGNIDVEFYYYLTWSFATDCRLWSFLYSDYDQIQMYQELINATEEYVLPNPDIKGIIPCLTSIQNARATWMGDTFNQPGNYNPNFDGYHLNDKGDLVAAMTWVSYFTQKSARDFKIDTSYDGWVYAAIAGAVDDAIKNPWEVTVPAWNTTHEHTANYETVAPPTCGESGQVMCVCTECGLSYADTVPPTGNHTYDDHRDVECNVCYEVRGFAYTVTNGQAAITGYTDALPTEAVIPFAIKGYPVTAIEDSAFKDCASLTSVIIPTSVTAIGKNVFLNCDSLTSVFIPNSITSIGQWAFCSCDALTAVTIPDSVITIGESAFKNCSSLSSVTIGDSVTTIGREAFNNCSSLSSVTIPDSVTTIGACAFEQCDSLTSVTIPDNVTAIGNSTFSYCDSLTAIEVSERNAHYSSQDGVLFNKDKTELLTYPAGKKGAYTIPNSVTTISSNAFIGCTGITSVTIGDSVDTIGSDAFHGCSSLTTIAIPDSVTTIDFEAFIWCTGITSVIIGNGVTTIGEYAFYECDNLTDVYYSGSEEERAKITIFVWGNASLLNAAWHYNYSPEPVVTPGDVDGNGKINNKDLGRLQQFLNEWAVTVNEVAADVTSDGKVNNKDLGLLQQYLADWDVTLG